MVYRHLLNFWPLVPALDIQNITDESDESSYTDEPFFSYQSHNWYSERQTVLSDDERNICNCLIIGDGIGCLVKTLSRMYRHNSNNLNIYVAHSFYESMSRDLLFLYLFGDDMIKFSLLERAETFLEILGNTHLRASTKLFVESKSAEILEKLVCLNENENILPFVSVNHLKQKEVDNLVTIFNYLKDETGTFYIGKGWENALRSYFGSRYDSRRNLFDYHFNMKLDYRMINLRKYIDWCETGIAFRFRQSKYNYPNKTMRFEPSDTSSKSGARDMYVGDIATSPYVVFGVETGNTSLLKEVNGEYQSNSEDISKFNLIDMMNEFLSCARKLGTKNVMIHLLLFETFCKMQKFTNFFDVVYVSCDMMPRVGILLSSVLKENGIVIFETMKNVVNSTSEQKLMYCEEIDRLARCNGLEVLKRADFDDNENYQIFICSEKKGFHRSATNNGFE